MPDEWRSRMARVAAWWRRGWDAELLACAPATDERGESLTWGFPHPVNRSPLWRLRRPWIAVPVTMIAAPQIVTAWLRGRVPTLTEVGESMPLVVLGLVFGVIIYHAARPRVEAAALRTWRIYRWRATTALDMTIRDASRETQADAPDAAARESTR